MTTKDPVCVFCEGPVQSDPDAEEDDDDEFYDIRYECKNLCRGPKESKLVLCQGGCNETHYDSSSTSYKCFNGSKHLEKEQHKGPRLYCQNCYFESPCYLRPFACDLDDDEKVEE
jgi:hypothetical protein